MKSRNGVLIPALLLAAIAGAALQVLAWNGAQDTGLGVAGRFITIAALSLLAIFAPRYARQLRHPLRDWRINLFVCSIVIIALFVLIALVYARYYEPLVEFINHGGDAASALKELE